MNLSRYLHRISAPEPGRPTIALLRDLLRAHVMSVPFENVDVQLGRRLSMDVESAYDKIVERGRGGWCYEQNGLFGWALREAGFEVMRVAAGVMRHERGEAADANHLCLLVRSPDNQDGWWLADVGFGGSLLEPLPLRDVTTTHTPFRVGLRRQPEGHWRFWENAGGDDFSYDFDAEAADESALENKCRVLQSDPGSSFVLNLVAQRRKHDTHMALRGRVLTTTTSRGRTTQLLDSAEALVAALDSVFGLEISEAAGLWPRILARHELLFGGENA